MNKKIIIQARTGSTRLPKKMIMPFFNGKALLEIVIERLHKNFKNNIILATSTNENDNIIERISNNYGLSVFRGNENDVLNRFIECAKNYQVQGIVRVCADNPFIMPEYIEELINFSTDADDYLSYRFPDGTPVIKSHIGLFGEYTTLKTLQKVYELTTDKIYREHVTNYIYGNKNIFNVRFLDLPKIIVNRKDIRLTIDTIEDFEIISKLYGKLNVLRGEEFLKALLFEVDNDINIKQTMNQQINKYEK